MLGGYGLSQEMSSPTLDKGHILHVFITHKYEKQMYSDLQVVPGISDRAAIVRHLSSSQTTPGWQKLVVCRNIKAIDGASLARSVQPASPDSIDDAVKHENAVLGKLLDIFAPGRIRRAKKRPGVQASRGTIKRSLLKSGSADNLNESRALTVNWKLTANYSAVEDSMLTPSSGKRNAHTTLMPQRTAVMTRSAYSLSPIVFSIASSHLLFLSMSAVNQRRSSSASSSLPRFVTFDAVFLQTWQSRRVCNRQQPWTSSGPLLQMKSSLFFVTLQQNRVI